MKFRITSSILFGLILLGLMSYYSFFESIPDGFKYYKIADRKYLARIPDSRQVVPLFIILHGSNATAKKMLIYSRAEKYQDAIVIVPEKKALLDWDIENPQKEIEFLEAIINKFPGHPVHLAGYSSGGYLAQIFACNSSTSLTSLSLVASSTPKSISNCPQQKLNVKMFNGTKDPFYKFDSSKNPKLLSVNDSYKFWQNHSNSTELIKIEAGGHTWPGASTSLRIKLFLGTTDQSIDPLLGLDIKDPIMLY